MEFSIWLITTNFLLEKKTGLRVGKLQPPIIISIIIVRYVILPVVGVAIVLVAGEMGFLSKDPLYRYVLMIQFTIPPAMNIGTSTS